MTATLAHETPMLSVRLGDPRVVREMLDSAGALAHGHFELLGGSHSDSFIRFSRIATRPQALETTAGWLLPTVAAWMLDAVVAPATAGVALAATLGKRLGLPVALADVDGDGRAVAVHTRELVSGKRVLLVNDVVTTGTGMTALAHVARDADAFVAGAAWFLSRNDLDVSSLIEAPTSAVGDLLLSQWTPESCPLCADAEELVHAAEIN